MTDDIPADALRRALTVELCRRSLWHYCKTIQPDFYRDEHTHLRTIADNLQEFLDSDERYMLVEAPPRHGKSRTLTTAVPWILGTRPEWKIITASYNETLSTQFSTTARDAMIMEPTGDRIVYSDVFDVRLKQDSKAKNLWRIEGSGVPSYLATSPSGTVTGMGGDCCWKDTKIQTNVGEITIQEAVSREDCTHVLSANFEKSCFEYKRIQAKKRVSSTKTVIISTREDELRCTLDHRIFVCGRGWIEAKSIVVGDVLVSCKAFDNQAVLSVEEVTEEGFVYDIQVEDNHNFFANGILVHNCIIIDDILKNALEAFNEDVLDKHWSWFLNTLMSRLEGARKVVIVMTRWASHDLAGRLREHLHMLGEPPPRTITLKALQDDGTMLCEDILSREEYDLQLKTRGSDKTALAVFSANYQQEPLDVEGLLYGEFLQYDELPPRDTWHSVRSYTDTADTGADFLCSLAYVVDNDKNIYITDVVYTQDDMSITEREVAQMLDRSGVQVAHIESNNGGRGFGRNVQALLREAGNTTCRIDSFAQTANKNSRILAGSSGVMNTVHFPANWRYKWQGLYSALTRYNRLGKNKHDDAPDALTGAWEKTDKLITKGWTF